MNKEGEFKKLSLILVIFIVIGNILGVSIFILPKMIVGYVNNPFIYLLAWFVGGLIALFGAIIYGKLGTSFPKSGGDYIFLKEAYNELIAFLSGWSALLITFSGSIAIMSIGLFQYQGPEIFGSWIGKPLIDNSSIGLTITWVQVFSILIVWILTLLNYFGITINAKFQMVLIMIVILSLFIFGLLSLTKINVSDNIQLSNIDFSSIDYSKFFLSLIPIFFAYAGWNIAVYIGDEIKNPKRNLSLALLIGTCFVICIYIFLNYIYVTVVGLENIKGADNIGAVTTELIFGKEAVIIINIIIFITIITTIDTTIMAGARIYYAMAKDNLFFITSAQKLHPSFNTPHISLFFQAIWTTILILFETFQQLVVYSTSMMVIISLFIVIGFFIFIKRKIIILESLKQKVIVYLCSFIYLIFSGLILFYTLINESINMVIGILLMLIGIPIYYLIRLRKKKSSK